MVQNQTTKTGGAPRGFAAMDPAAQRSIASEGGRAAHAKGTAHEFTSAEAAEAGRKGGQARARNSQLRQAALIAQRDQMHDGNDS